MRGKLAPARPSNLLLRDKPGFLQHANMLHHCRQRHAVRLGQFSDGGLAEHQASQNRAPCGISQRAKGGIQSRRILNHTVYYPLATLCCQAESLAHSTALSGTFLLRIPPEFDMLLPAYALVSPRSRAAVVPVYVPAPVLTSQYDNARTGTNLHETILTPQNVNAQRFGKIHSLLVDGDVYAQPMFVPAVEISGNGKHNVVYVATEHDSVYVFDADAVSAEPLWHANFLDASKGVGAGVS
jgi:hypothetical protein